MQTYLTLFFILFLSGCAPTIESVKQAQMSAKSCCKSYSEFSLESLANGQTLYFDINSNSQFFNFESGGSYFKAFKIETNGMQKKLVTVRSYIQTLGFGRENYFFHPSVILLDNKFNLIKKIDTQADLVRNDFFSSGDIVLEKSIELTGNEQYLIICTTNKLLASKTPYDSTQSTYAAGVVLSRTGTTMIPNGPVGKLRIQIQ